MSASGAADSGIGLAITAGVGMTHLGPGLAPGMGEAEAFERLNAWGVARDGELVDLRASLANTQAAVGATFSEARGALMMIVNDFRMEAETMRSHSIYARPRGTWRASTLSSPRREPGSTPRTHGSRRTWASWLDALRQHPRQCSRKPCSRPRRRRSS
jgi:hypothetical protein